MSTRPNFLPERETREWQDLDNRHYLHPFTTHKEIRENSARIIERAEDIYVYAHNGEKLLDGMAGLWCCNLGYSRPEIVDAVHQQLQYLPFYNNFFQCAHTTVIEASHRIINDVAPDHITDVFFTGSGSEANDTNIRIVRRYWDVQGQSQRKYIISRDNAYHGSTIAATSLGGIADMKKQVDGMGNVEHIMPPYHFELSEHGESEEAFGERAAQALEDKILALGPENVAAFIGEPIMGAGGVKIPPANYWKLIEKICRKYNILLILDEVITGFGRLGHWFACDYYGIKPDLITFAKAVTNGFQQLGGVLVSDRVSKVLNSDSQEFTHGFTYSGHPAACAAALATIGVFERDNVLDYVRNEIGPYFTERLSELKGHPLVGEVRTIGMLGAIEIVKDKASKTRFPGEVNAGGIIRDCFINEGVIMRAVGQTMVAAPPLVITKSQVDELIEKARAGLDKAASKLI